MAMAMREAASRRFAAWRRHGSELGIAQGYATLGQIGFFDRSGYTATGTACNLASRLCAEAKDGQILISSRIAPPRPVLPSKGSSADDDGEGQANQRMIDRTVLKRSAMSTMPDSTLADRDKIIADLRR